MAGREPQRFVPGAMYAYGTNHATRWLSGQPFAPVTMPGTAIVMREGR
jgi:hypothetical protein